MTTYGTFDTGLPAPSDFELEAADRQKWAQPQHGAERNRRTVTDTDMTTFTTTGGQQFEAPLVSHTYVVTERYCATCGKWVETRGIIGAILCIECNTDWHGRNWNTPEE